MKNYTKECHTWLIDNNVHVYGNTFDYKGSVFTVERAGTNFYCVDRSGAEYRASRVKVIAICWACQQFDAFNTIVNPVEDTNSISYYKQQLTFVDAEDRKIKITSLGGTRNTKLLDLNDQSAAVLVEWLSANYNIYRTN